VSLATTTSPGQCPVCGRPDEGPVTLGNGESMTEHLKLLVDEPIVGTDHGRRKVMGVWRHREKT
jgi:hypothetical protein